MMISRVIRATVLAVMCLLVTSTEAEVVRTPSAGVFAYAPFYCSGEVCEYWPPLPTGTFVVTPFGQTLGLVRSRARLVAGCVADCLFHGRQETFSS